MQTVRQGYEAFNRGDFAGLLEHLEDDVVWHDAPQVPGARMHVGHEEVLSYLASFPRVWDEPRFEADEIHAAGDAVVSLSRFKGRGRQSGVEVATPLAHMFRFREGRVYRVVTYLDRAQALRALEELREGRSRSGVDE